MKFVHWSTGWYYNIELEEGGFTDGTARKNLALTRKLLRNVDVKGKTCIDIGTTEAVIPVLLKRAGAKTVVAYDRLDISEKVNLVKRFIKRILNTFMASHCLICRRSCRPARM